MVMLGIQEAMHAEDSGHRGDWNSRHGETPGTADTGGHWRQQKRETLGTADTETVGLGDTESDSRHRGASLCNCLWLLKMRKIL